MPIHCSWTTSQHTHRYQLVWSNFDAWKWGSCLYNVLSIEGLNGLGHHFEGYGCVMLKLVLVPFALENWPLFCFCFLGCLRCCLSQVVFQYGQLLFHHASCGCWSSYYCCRLGWLDGLKDLTSVEALQGRVSCWKDRIQTSWKLLKICIKR